jgi:hypothetical protein
MRTLDMVLDPEKTLEMEIVRPPRRNSAAVAMPVNPGLASAHRTVQMLIALVAAMIVVMFVTG